MSWRARPVKLHFKSGGKHQIYNTWNVGCIFIWRLNQVRQKSASVTVACFYANAPGSVRLGVCAVDMMLSVPSIPSFVPCS